MRFHFLPLALLLALFGQALLTPWLQSDRAALAQPALAAARPLSTFSYALIEAALPARLLQLALHAACALLAAALFARLLEPAPARIAALLFAFHPLQAEAVGSLSARPILLAALLCLLCWHAWLRGKYWLAAVLFAAAPLAHEQAALFPLLLLVTGPPRRLPLLAMSAFSLLSFWRAPRPPLDLDLAAQLGIAALRDLWLFLLPVRLTPAPELRATPLPAALAWGAVIAVALLALSARQRPPARWLSAALCLLLPAGLLAPALEAGTDRLMYLPLLALAPLAGLLFAAAPPRILMAVGLLLLLITHAQTRLWMDERALWTEAVRLAPRSAYPRLRLAAVSDPDLARTLREEARTLK